VGVKKLFKRMTAPVEELDRERRRARCEELGTTPITDVATRVRSRVGGEVTSVRIVPRAGAPSLEVVVDDGYGRAVGVFFGRRALAGLHPGRQLVMEGVAQRDHGRTVFYNPLYTLL
jgi:hypothetical protein